MAILNPQQITPAGITPAYAAAAGGGDSFFFSGREYVELINGSGAGITVTIPAQRSCGTFGTTSTAHDIVKVIGAGARMKIKIPAEGYVDANGRVQLTYSSVTSLTIGVFVG